MSDFQALLAAVVANPDDDLPRLVAADHLDEHDQPERAEFIRLSCELDHTPRWPCRAATPPCHRCDDCTRYAALLGRWRQLCDRHLRFWQEQDPVFGVRVWDDGDESFAFRLTWRRGFVEGVECAAEDWVRHGDAVLARHPVTAVTLTTVPEWVCGVRHAPDDADSDPPGEWTYGLLGRNRVFGYHELRLDDDDPRRAGGPWQQLVAERLLSAEWPTVRHWRVPDGGYEGGAVVRLAETTPHVPAPETRAVTYTREPPPPNDEELLAWVRSGDYRVEWSVTPNRSHGHQTHATGFTGRLRLPPFDIHELNRLSLVSDLTAAFGTHRLLRFTGIIDRWEFLDAFPHAVGVSGRVVTTPPVVPEGVPE